MQCTPSFLWSHKSIHLPLTVHSYRGTTSNKDASLYWMWAYDHPCTHYRYRHTIGNTLVCSTMSLTDRGILGIKYCMRCIDVDYALMSAREIPHSLSDPMYLSRSSLLFHGIRRLISYWRVRHFDPYHEGIATAIFYVPWQQPFAPFLPPPPPRHTIDSSR